MESEQKCGCKGIRTCLLCENEGNLSKPYEENKIFDQYLYCPYCNLCWPVDRDKEANPLYLGRLTVIPDFITEDEEAEIIAAIDTIEWMPSQSGRKKQDFGPKVNFKKKKGKIGDFKGFPRFTENLIKRLGQYKDLSDFKPVELCHLDYDPDRGSAIEPHIDDSWIWGERLVTINLSSTTILTFTPANREGNCNCLNHCLGTSSMGSIKEKCYSHKVVDDQNSCMQTIKEKKHLLSKVFAGHSFNDANGSLHSTKENKHCKYEHSIYDSVLCNHKDILLDKQKSYLNCPESNPIGDMCSEYRIEQKTRNVEVQVSLPPRSLVVVAGCCRHNWFHEIKRKDIVSRRLAMTFRELSWNFMAGGSDQALGVKLLELGRTFWEIKM